MTAWNLYILDRGLNRIGEMDDYTSIDAVAKYNDVGTWTVTVDGRANLAGELATPGYGMELTRDDVTVVAGLTTNPQIKQNGDQRVYTIAGVDHNVWLKRRVVHPCPTVAVPPYSAQEYSVVTDVASTVLRSFVDQNAGPGALAPRQVPLLTLAADPLVGSTITGRGRWQVLLQFLQDTAVAGGPIGFKIAKVATALQFQVYPPVDRSATVKLSTEMGNVFGYQAETEVSSTNYTYVGGGGEGTARTIYENGDSTDEVTWNARIETFVDRRDTTDATELSQESTKTLTEGAGKAGITVNPVDIEHMQFLVDYQLGDRVTYVTDGVANTEIIREVTISLTPNGPQRTIPGLTSASNRDALALFRLLRDMRKRLTDLERR